MYTKHFTNREDGVVAATYYEAGDRVRLIRFGSLDAAGLEKFTRESCARTPFNAPEPGMKGTIQAIVRLGGGKCCFVIDWDDDRLDSLIVPLIYPSRGDVFEPVNA